MGSFTGVQFETFTLSLSVAGWVSDNSVKLPPSGYILSMVLRLVSGTGEFFSLYVVNGASETLASAPVDNNIFASALNLDCGTFSTTTAFLKRRFEPWSRPYGVVSKASSTTIGETDLLVGGVGTNIANAVFSLTIGVQGVV